MTTPIIPCPVCSEGWVACVPKDRYICNVCGPIPGEPYHGLSETRKKDRKIMVESMMKLCVKLGIPYKVDWDWCGKKILVLLIGEPDGLQTRIDFDGKSIQPDVFVVPWFYNGPRGIGIRDDFTYDRNQYHMRKATDVFYGFTSLITNMSIRLSRIAEGTATGPVEIRDVIDVGQLPKHQGSMKTTNQ